MGQSQEAKEHALCVLQVYGYGLDVENMNAQHWSFQDGILPSAVQRQNIMLVHLWTITLKDEMRGVSQDSCQK